MIDWSEAGFSSVNKAITKGQPFAIKGHIEYRDPQTGMWNLVAAVMDVEGHVKIDGQDYKIGSAKADLDINGNMGVGYFNLVATISTDAPAGEGVLSVKALANGIYAESEISETQASGAPKNIDVKTPEKKTAVKKVSAAVKVPAKAKVLSKPKLKSSKIR